MDAKYIIGKSVVVFMTIINQNDEIIEKNDFAGTVVEISQKSGVVVANEALKKYVRFPAQLDAFRAAKRNKKYILPSMGYEIQDVDLICEMTVRRTT